MKKLFACPVNVIITFPKSYCLCMVTTFCKATLALFSNLKANKYPTIYLILNSFITYHVVYTLLF